jgi:nucleotide-binding universal stress UspA family protein
VNIQSILVPLDGTSSALAAVPVARSLSKATAATLVMLHVGDRALPARQRLAELGLSPEQQHGVVVEQPTGPPAEAIVGFARTRPGSIIVMCTHTAGQPEGILGRVTGYVVRQVRDPVILVQPGRSARPWHLERMLLPHDGTVATSGAMNAAGSLAHRTGAEVLVLHVACSVPRVAGGTFAAPRYVDQPQHEWAAWESEFLERMTALGHPPAEVRFRMFMVAGKPGPEIVRFADSHQVDLIALAWHGRWDAHRAQTLKCVLEYSNSPVLVARTAEPT